MPHIVIEHDQSIQEKIDLPALVGAVHASLASQETILLDSLKSRSVLADNVIIGTGVNNQFLHIDIRLLPGRSVALKEKMAQDIHTADIECILTVNISELGVYIK